MLDKAIAKETAIAVVSTHPMGNTGYGTQTNQLVKRLIKLGYQVTCIAGGGSQQWSPAPYYYDDLKGELIKIPVLPTMGMSNGINIWEPYKRKYGFRLLITLWDSFVIKDYDTYQADVPAIHWIPIDTAYTTKMAGFLKHANQILAMSQFGYTELIKFHPPHQIHYIPHGIDTNVFKPLPEKIRETARTTMGLKPDDLLILFCGANAGERKLIPTLIHIFKQLTLDEEFDHVYLYVFTNIGEKYPISYDLVEYAKTLGLQGRMIFPDQDTFHIPWETKEMAALFACADLYFSTSMGEGFGLPQVEAMSCEVPLYTLNNSTGPELVNCGKNGWLGEMIDPSIVRDRPNWIPTMQEYSLPHERKVLEQLKTILSDPKTLREKGKNARQFVVEHYDWDILMPKWEALICEQLEKSLVHYEITRPEHYE